MTLLETSLVLQHILQTLGKPIEMTLEQFNNLARVAQEDLFKEFAYGYTSGSGYAVDMRTLNALHPFWLEQQLIGSFGSLYGLEAFSYTAPSDVHVITSCMFVGAGTIPTTIKKVDIITDAELSERLSNTITYPSADDPVAVIYGTATPKHIRVFPRSVSAPPAPTLNITYLKTPPSPLLVETITNGARTQHASSVGFTFDSVFHVDILRIMLKYLGIAVGNEFLTQAVEQQKMNEK